MSSETIKPTRGWAKHESRRKADERRNRPLVLPTTPEDRQRKLTTASWTAVKGLLNLSTANNDSLHSVYEEIREGGQVRDIVRGWYDAAYKDAISVDGQGTKYRDEFSKHYVQDQASNTYDPMVVRRVMPLLRMIETFVNKPAMRR